MPAAFSPWDLALLAVVTAMGTLLAYLSDPRWKAFLLSLPFPFSLANLSLGEPIGPSHALGLWSRSRGPSCAQQLFPKCPEASNNDTLAWQ
jgi:hypothetical protein